MEVIRIAGYTEMEKLNIARRYLVPKQKENNGLVDVPVEFRSDALKLLIHRYTKESGVRSLEREISSVCRKLARDSLTNDDKKRSYLVGPKKVQRLLGPPKYRYGTAELSDQVGVVTGLAWTELGGELLTIEATVLPGKGKLMITGKLGEVMQESAQAAMSYVRSRAEHVGLDKRFVENVDIHVHVPEGAIPKDGPSAGIAMATTLVSGLCKIPVRKEVAMTGEITLRGRVLPIGGLKEKILAGHRAGIRKVLIPKENEKDIRELPPKVRKALQIVPVEHMDEVLREALLLSDPDAFFKRLPAAAELHPGEAQVTATPATAPAAEARAQGDGATRA
jgi:ATP-dependent Lon protease